MDIGWVEPEASEERLNTANCFEAPQLLQLSKLTIALRQGNFLWNFKKLYKFKMHGKKGFEASQLLQLSELPTAQPAVLKQGKLLWIKSGTETTHGIVQISSKTNTPHVHSRLFWNNQSDEFCEISQRVGDQTDECERKSNSPKLPPPIDTPKTLLVKLHLWMKPLRYTGCSFNWYPPKKLKYVKPRLGESTLT